MMGKHSSCGKLDVSFFKYTYTVAFSAPVVEPPPPPPVAARSLHGMHNVSKEREKIVLEH